ncbi:MAG: aldose 1-epimerase family protein [Clostridia bacterium]|nr:aldose 1-epimerase family protein [Clostridia bacterium]
MLITIKNEKITVSADTFGAQLMSIKGADGTEYLWQGDPAYWQNRAPNLFPFIARLTEGKYIYDGREYAMPNHGFAGKREFTAELLDNDCAVFTLESNDEIKEMYPFNFVFRVIYALRDNSLDITYSVENTDDKRIYFAVGGHPGFCVPLEEGKEFSDYSLTFTDACRPDRVGFTPSVFLSGVDEEYPLEDGKTLRLAHEKFDDDAIILKNMCREVTLCHKDGGRGLTVTYPDMPYLGIWHRPKTDAPYVCIEPWSSLPSRQDIKEDLACKSDLVSLPAGMLYENTWSVTVF